MGAGAAESGTLTKQQLLEQRVVERSRVRLPSWRVTGLFQERVARASAGAWGIIGASLVAVVAASSLEHVWLAWATWVAGGAVVYGVAWLAARAVVAVHLRRVYRTTGDIDGDLWRLRRSPEFFALQQAQDWESRSVALPAVGWAIAMPASCMLALAIAGDTAGGPLGALGDVGVWLMRHRLPLFVAAVAQCGAAVWMLSRWRTEDRAGLWVAARRASAGAAGGAFLLGTGVPLLVALLGDTDTSRVLLELELGALSTLVTAAVLLPAFGWLGLRLGFERNEISRCRHDHARKDLPWVAGLDFAGDRSESANTGPWSLNAVAPSERTLAS